jgi:hypothetical protein
MVDATSCRAVNPAALISVRSRASSDLSDLRASICVYNFPLLSLPVPFIS